MHRYLILLLICLPLCIGCQEKYDNPPYNKDEEKLREIPKDYHRILIPKDWEKMDSLTFLRFNNLKEIYIGVGVDSIPVWISKLKTVELINNFNFTNKKSKKFPTYLFELKELHNLLLDNQNYDSLPAENLSNLLKLKRLTLFNNKIKRLPKCINKLISLEVLDLSNNQLTELPENIYKLPSLKQIDLTGNPLKDPKEIKKRFKEKGVEISIDIDETED